MPNRVQTLRSSLTGSRPVVNTRQPGELYVNFADNQLGVVNAAQTAQDLIPIRYFSTACNYNINDYVVNSGVLYKATVAITAGAFNSSQWTAISASVTVSDTSPTNPQPGNLWFDSLGGQLYVYYNDGTSSQWVVAVTNLAAPYVQGSSEGGFVNKLRNGTFDVWQRGTNLGNPANGSYTADGWILWTPGASVAALQRGGRMWSRWALEIDGVAGNTLVALSQRIESNIAGFLNQQTITFQIWVYNNTGAAITPTLALSNPTVYDNYAVTTLIMGPVNLQPCPNGQWTRLAYTYTFAPATQVWLGLLVYLNFGPLTAGQSIYVTEADLRATPGLPVGLCANPPPPELRPVHEELVFCQRYYEIGGFYNGNFVCPSGSHTNWPFGGVGFKVTKRIAPISIGISGFNQSGAMSNFGGVNMTTQGFDFQANVTPAASEQWWGITGWSASAEL